MKKLLIMIFALATVIGSIQAYSRYRSDEPIRRGIGGAATGALLGGAFGGGRGAAIGAGVGGGLGLLSAAGDEGYYYDEPGYYQEPVYNEPYYQNYGPGYVGVGLPFLMNVESDVESLESTQEYPVNRNYLAPVLQKPYVEYWQKEGFFPVDEYEVPVGPYGNRLPIEFNIDTATSVFPKAEPTDSQAMQEQTRVTPVVDTSYQKPVEPVVAPVVETTRAITRPVVETTAAIVEPVAQATATITQPIADVTYAAREPVVDLAYDIEEPVEDFEEDIAEPVAQVTEDVVRPAARVVAPVVETAEDVVTAPLRIF